MNDTTHNAEAVTAKVSRPYSLVCFSVSKDTIAEVHACGCAHTKRMDYRIGSVGTMHYQGETLAELAREVELEFNSDFAGDYGLTPAEYIEEHGGYRAGTDIGSEIRIMPCVKIGSGK